jgi:hypothetical protein
MITRTCSWPMSMPIANAARGMSDSSVTGPPYGEQALIQAGMVSLS